MIDIIIDNFNKIAGTILGAALVAYFGYRTYKKTRFNQAAAAFRSRVLTELKGIYPVTQHLDAVTFQRFSKSIIEIESAAAEFRFYIVRKGTFDTAIKEYCDYCKQITKGDYTNSIFWPGTIKDGISPQVRFEHIVNNLLSFAKDK